MTPSWWKKEAERCFNVANRGKIVIVSSQGHGPWISAQVMNSSAIAFTHTGSQDPPPWECCSREPLSLLSHSLSTSPVLPPPNAADPPRSLAPSARLSAPLLESLTKPCSSFPSQAVESECVGFGSGNSPKLTWVVLAEDPVLCQSPMPMRCVTPSKTLNVSEYHSFIIKEDM